ncbi:protein couch potato [Toxorhynchites rutilus septentrionalis]|uniref:protein couch potato n=1 Tax=Toxorhynchites rutilus septentrionalis TaxID=329112 RepID=UPI002479BF25|nr:protein couch potato [Toxorhynchites rutilus septentrionalis]
MHFWIDKRSQACGFGRARVAASLSGGGGLGFGHPRRIPRKSMVTPIHRFQTVDCTRPHPYRHQQSQSQLLQQQSQSQNTSQHYHQQQQQQQPPTSNTHPNIQQHQAQLHSSSHYNQHNSILPASTHHSQASSQNNHLHQQSQQQQQQQSQQTNSYHVPVTVNHIYSNTSSQPNAIEVDNSSAALGVGTLNQHVPHIGHDAQLLPAHLKCGMWASLALATVFVAGAKFYFDHQGTGLEVLIFCAFSATFFLAACTVSLCRRPRDLQIPANNVISETISNGEQNSLQNNQDLMNSNPSPLLNGSVSGTQQSSLAVIAPPPPYHIAILLPECTKETDESPPPSYDKIVI